MTVQRNGTQPQCIVIYIQIKTHLKRDFFDSGVTKSCAIKIILQKVRYYPDPTPRQMNYLLAEFRRDGNKPVLNVSDLIQWCEDREAFPNFVVQK